MTNKDFCYWLQGYFEICQTANLTAAKISIIKGTLDSINEPLGFFTSWLSKVIDHLATLEFKQELLDFFLPEIKRTLNGIFLHVIDDSYEMNISSEEALRIHDGRAHD